MICKSTFIQYLLGVQWKLIRYRAANSLIDAELGWVLWRPDISNNEYRLSVSIITLIRNAC
jgi:hypothetical protein